LNDKRYLREEQILAGGQPVVVPEKPNGEEALSLSHPPSPFRWPNLPLTMIMRLCSSFTSGGCRKTGGKK